MSNVTSVNMDSIIILFQNIVPNESLFILLIRQIGPFKLPVSTYDCEGPGSPSVDMYIHFWLLTWYRCRSSHLCSSCNLESKLYIINYALRHTFDIPNILGYFLSSQTAG